MALGAKVFRQPDDPQHDGAAHGHRDCTAKNRLKEDRMESFWLAETLKYFYLMFAEPELVSLDEYLLNTRVICFGGLYKYSYIYNSIGFIIDSTESRTQIPKIGTSTNYPFRRRHPIPNGAKSTYARIIWGRHHVSKAD